MQGLVEVFEPGSNIQALERISSILVPWTKVEVVAPAHAGNPACGLLLKFFALPAAFVAAGGLGLAMTLLSSYIPRRVGRARQRLARLTPAEPMPRPAPPVAPTG